MREINEITGTIVSASYDVHTRIGPGLLESVYEAVLARMLEKRGLHVERQKPVVFEYEGMRFDEAFRVDLLVEDRVVVELKAVEKLARVHGKQVLTYLRLLDLPIGLLINFGAASLSEGIERILNPRAPAIRPLHPRPAQTSTPCPSQQESHTGSTGSTEELR